MRITRLDDYEGSPTAVREQVMYALECIARGDRVSDLPISSTLLYRAIAADEDLARAYLLAKLSRADLMADKAQSTAEDDSRDMLPDGKPNGAAVARDALRVKTYTWLASVLAPRQYGRALEADDSAAAKRPSRLVIESSADALQRARTINGDEGQA